jgi:hypothetical protein
MSKSIEYLFAPHVDIADAFASAEGWRSYGRAQWQRRGGTVVYFLSLVEQLEIVSPGEIVHVIGTAPAPLRALKRRKAIVVSHDIRRAS